MHFLELRKNLKKDFSNFPKHKIAIIGDSSTQLLSQALKGYSYEVGIDFQVYESDYNQVEQEIFTSSSKLYDFQPDFILIFNSVQKLLANFQDIDETEKKDFANRHIEHTQTILTAIKEKSNARILYCNFVELNDSVFGNYGNKLEMSFIYQIRKINYSLMNLAIQNKNLFINDVSTLSNNEGFVNSFDPKLYVNGDFVFSLDFTALIAKNTLDIILPILGKLKKCLILDLDNTMWGGIIGDDGIENIQVGDLGIGKAFTQLQKWAKQLKQRGIILAVCSKNTENIAKEPFEKHPEMVLRLEDISIFVANWENKASNIRYIQSVLNIGFDSMVFIDDNPFERNLVRSELPDVVVPELPDDPSFYVQYLRSLNLFETATFSEEDIERTRQYQEEAQRTVIKRHFVSEDEYLQNLEMVSEVKKIDKFTIPRVAQLTQRSNQFNLRTIRYTDEDIDSISKQADYFTLSFDLKDKFGAYGLISVVILKKDKDTLFIDTWVMSCRVLKRGMEQFIINEIVKIAQKNQINHIIGEYIATPKNAIVQYLFSDLGFEANNGLWKLEIKQYQNHKTHIYAKY